MQQPRENAALLMIAQEEEANVVLPTTVLAGAESAVPHTIALVRVESLTEVGVADLPMIAQAAAVSAALPTTAQVGAENAGLPIIAQEADT